MRTYTVFYRLHATDRNVTALCVVSTCTQVDKSRNMQPGQAIQWTQIIEEIWLL